MMSHALRHTAGWVIIAVLAVVMSVHGDTTLDRVLPENAVLVVGVKNVEQSLERLRNTPINDLLQSPEIREQWAKLDEEFLAGWKEMLEGLGLDEAVRAWPSGAAGFGLYSVIDPELGTPTMATIGFAQFGEKTDDVMELIGRAVRHGHEESVFEHEELDILGRTVHVMDFGAVAQAVEDEFGGDPFSMMPDFSALLDGFNRIYLVRDGQTILIGSDLGSLTESLDRIDREALGVGGRETYQRIRDQLGEHDAFGIMLTRDALRMLGGLDQQGMLTMIGPMISGVVGEIDGFGSSLRIDSPNAIMESRMSVYMPRGKGGLTRLIENQQPREELPRFAGPDTISYTSINVDFSRVSRVLGDIIRTNPFLQMMAGEEYRQMEGTIQRVMATLGSRVYMSGSMTRPITPESMVTLFAVDCRDPEGFENFLAQFAPGLGLQPRDFLGNRIYSMDDEMNMFQMMTGMPVPSMSIGIGGGYVFVGPTTSVEQSLRVISQQERMPSLADEPIFRRAEAMLPDRPVLAWGYSDFVTSMEGSMEVMKQSEAAMIEQMRDDFPELAAEWEAELKDDFDLFTALDWSLIRRHLGPSVMYIESVDNGFVGTTYFLRASDGDE